MRDPIHAHVFQPMVEMTQCDPRRAAILCADAFLLVVLTLSAVRIATLNPTTHSGLYGFQTMHVVGGVIVHGWMRFSAVNGAVARTGPMGTLHAGMRAVFAMCLLIDVGELHLLLTTDLVVSPTSLGRSLLQFAEDVLATAALYLSLCDRPKPRRRRPRTTALHA
jgi:hypothetical protein